MAFAGRDLFGAVAPLELLAGRRGVHRSGTPAIPSRPRAAANRRARGRRDVLHAALGPRLLRTSSLERQSLARLPRHRGLFRGLSRPARVILGALGLVALIALAERLSVDRGGGPVVVCGGWNRFALDPAHSGIDRRTIGGSITRPGRPARRLARYPAEPGRPRAAGAAVGRRRRAHATGGGNRSGATRSRIRRRRPYGGQRARGLPSGGNAAERRRYPVPTARAAAR